MSLAGVVLLTSAACGSAPAPGPGPASGSSASSSAGAPTLTGLPPTTAPPGGTAADRPTDQSRSTTTPGSPMLGVFRGTRKDDVADFEGWLGRPVDAVVDFAAADTWAQIADPTYLLEHWQGTPYRLVLSVPLYPLRESADRQAAAAGAYDEHFAELGRRLVEQGRADAWIRLGWEFNMEVSYSYSTDPELFIAYFRRAVEALRSAPGQQFTIVWNPGNGTQEQDAARFYPGDAAVDIVGLDIYDAGYSEKGYPYPAGCSADCRTRRSAFVWDTMLYGGPRGLRFWVEFATARGKFIALPEWGLWSSAKYAGGEDNPDFIRRLHGFVSDPRNRVVMQAYFQYDNPQDRHSLHGFPRSAAAFRTYWGER